MIVGGESMKILGNGAYTLGVVYRTAFLDTFHLRLELDGRTIERDTTLINEHPEALSHDSELIGETPAEITCLHCALEVFSAASTSP